jgi:biopolymer transport protein ExbD
MSHFSAGGRKATMVLNLTALIDVVFLLIMFFVLVARFGSFPTLRLNLPRVDERTGELRNAGSNPVVDVVPRDQGGGAADQYRFGARSFASTPDGLAGLTAALRALRDEQPEVELSIRAERAEGVARVHPAMDAASAAGIRRVRLMMHPKGGEASP